MNNEPNDIEELLEVLIAVHNGLDADTAAKARELAEKVRQNPDYNQIKILEHFVLGVFDKLYANQKKPKEFIQIGDDFKIGIFDQGTKYSIELWYPLTNPMVSNCQVQSINNNYILNYIQQQVINNKFNKQQFIINLLQLAALKNNNLSEEDIIKQFPLE